jgi:general secretion pathway protein J
MTLLSLMVVLLLSSLMTSAKSWAQGDKVITSVNEISTVQHFFNHYLAHATPQWNDFIPEKERTLSFQGKKQALQFVSGFSASAERMGLQQFELTLIKKEHAYALHLTLTPFFPPSTTQEWYQDTITLIDNLIDFEVFYWGVNDETGEYKWHSEWLEKEQQPQLVKIILSFEDGRYCPEMIIPIKVDATYSNADIDSVPVEDEADTSQ